MINESNSIDADEILEAVLAPADATTQMVNQAMAYGDDTTVATRVADDVPKVGRNDPCPCGSGKKYKNCHGKLV
jgi:preprotein translocase subunit SecA